MGIKGKEDAAPENVIARMFGGEAGGFNPDLLSGRLEEMLPTIVALSSPSWPT